MKSLSGYQYPSERDMQIARATGVASRFPTQDYETILDVVNIDGLSPNNILAARFAAMVRSIANQSTTLNDSHYFDEEE